MIVFRTLMKRLDQRIRVIHYENKSAAGAKENKETPTAP